MNNEELKKARKRYRIALIENKRILEIKQEIEELKQTEEVIRYLELLKFENLQIETAEELINRAFAPIISNTEESNNIYVFMGSYTKHYGNTADTLSPIKNALWTDYNKYVDLETERCIQIPKRNIESFEKTHIVIDNKVPTLSTNFQDYYENFSKIQFVYYKTLTYTTKEKSLTKIKKIFNQ